MGLIARALESAGIPTLCMTSALSITRSVNPPRAAFLDFPLGHTTGRANEPDEQHSILLDALRAFETHSEPGAITELPYTWPGGDEWKDIGQREPGEHDERVGRVDTPQYQTERDRELAEAARDCGTCIWLE